MSRLLPELLRKRTIHEQLVEDAKRDIEHLRLEVKMHEASMADEMAMIIEIDRAIAVFTPAPDFAAEKETAREQLEREPEIPEGIPVIPATEWTEPLSGLSPDLSSDDPDEQDDASEFISDLTGDPAIEPEAGLHGESGGVVAQHECTCHPDDAPPVCQHLYAASQCQASYRNGASLGTLDSIEERPALNEAMQDEREQPVDLPQPEWNEPVTSEAKMFSHGIQSEQKPKPDPRDWPFSHLFTGKPKVDA